ncbi:hypothetical protein A1O3_06972 [Capronia epimyces CBS 606.96]|uniref:Amino acid transporter transmembrane domain-containing protein n=1 Tax=Capronia epimyces CBS 606.96 TaxID=1182542 RepID=W9XKD9_9EURO|nr:uncharacterized protein A1O3_06972 [Capronia epimyces CBS 606.96]EXJ80688.1 hypothetical protein A1O3_06972 [Capronia epimyces CBS 606.96]
MASSEKKSIMGHVAEPVDANTNLSSGPNSLDHEPSSALDDQEVFKSDGKVAFRTITWQRLIIILLKVQIATGVLGIPGAMGSLGAVPGALLIVGWQALNTYTACVLIDFRNKHPSCHTIVDMCGVMWGRIGREITGIIFVIAFVLCSGSGMLAISVALNALSTHGACSVWFGFVAMILVTMYSSIRTWNRMTWPMTVGFICVMGGILAVVIGVAVRDRPAAAPATGPFDLGFRVVGHPEFAAGITATATIFVSSAGGPGYIPIVAEMRRPQDYRKAVIPVGFIVAAVYLSMSMVVYYYCGVWIATPSLGSAGPHVKKIAYGIALPSLVVSAGIFNHTAAKYAFVRLMRRSKHFQRNSWQHWSVWLSANLVVAALAFILAEAIPVFNYMLALTGAVCFAPMSLMFPACMWIYQYGAPSLTKGWKGKLAYGFHLLILAVGTFLLVGGM